MKVLNILKSEPDETVGKLTEELSRMNETSVAVLYEGDVDWSALVDDIFAHEKVICWW